MNKIDLNKLIGMLANVGVVAGIVFLGIEMQQNNELLSTQVRRDLLESSTAITLPNLSNPELAHITYKASIDEELTPEEEYIYGSYVLHQITQMQWMYEEYAAGNLERLNLRGWRILGSRPRWREFFRDTVGRDRSSEFFQFVEENVFVD